MLFTRLVAFDDTLFVPFLLGSRAFNDSPVCCVNVDDTVQYNEKVSNGKVRDGFSCGCFTRIFLDFFDLPVCLTCTCTFAFTFQCDELNVCNDRLFRYAVSLQHVALTNCAADLSVV
jgi:hypothetical protein